MTKFIWFGIQNESRSIQSMYLISPEDKQVKKHLAKEIYSRQEKGQLNFQVKKNYVELCTLAWSVIYHQKVSLSLNSKLISPSPGTLFPWGRELLNKTDIISKWNLLICVLRLWNERFICFFHLSIERKLNLLVIWSVFQTILVKGTSDLLTYIETSQLTPSFGGTLSYDHKAWIKLQKVLTVLHLSVRFPF